MEATLGALLFVSGGLVTLLGMLAPHADHPDEVGLIVLSFAMVALGLLLLVLPARLVRKAPPLMIAMAVVFITLGIWLNGERDGGAPMFEELFYFWPALYVGYFFSVRRIVATLVAIAAAYAAVLTQLAATSDVLIPRYTITVASIVGTATAMHLIRRNVDRLVARLNELARTDVLTKLLNRRAFDEALQAELERSHRTQEPFALLLGDVDHFKAINDRRGHAAGDRALQHVARMLSTTSRSVDVVARVGGEEFALILPGADRAAGAEAAERLRAALRRSGDPVTMSFGVVEGPADGRLADDLLRAADRALYAAKAGGRDRIVIAERLVERDRAAA